MAVILENTPVAKDIYLMRLNGAPKGTAGQFMMLRQKNVLDPFLGRPLSIFDSCGEEASFLYQTAGRGTALFATLSAGQGIEVQGPYGNGFPLLPGGAVLIGGGIGCAPMYLLAKALREKEPERNIEVYLGFRDEAYLVNAFAACADEVHVSIGGVVTQDVDFTCGSTYYACGPASMLCAAAQAAEAADAQLFVSFEKRMACGVGACLSCSCKTEHGSKRVCRDGPVFDYKEVRHVF
jgi:dihydroorotate dehydrogenase electron transfer subunit